MPIHPLRWLRTPLVVLVLAASLPTVAAPAPPQILPLQHAVPSDILKFTHWDEGAALPEGVARVSAEPGDNALYIEATPEGYKRVKDIVRKLDIAARRVQVRSAFIYARVADVQAAALHLDLVPPSGAQSPFQIASGPGVDQLLAALTKRGTVVATPRNTTTNNVPASISQQSTDPDGSLVRQIGFALTPRINSDNTVTLSLHPTLSWRAPGVMNPNGTPMVRTDEFTTLRTFKSGDSVVLVLNVAGSGPTATELLFFVTPTILPAEGETSPPAR